MKETMKNNVLSVIIPAYNVESYIERCISSVLNQTYTDLEIIVIDDGSADRTGLIIDEISNQDNRIKVIHKKNEGLVKARKEGIRKATGNYVTFVDSDDWIEAEMYETMLLHMFNDNLDIVTSGLVIDDVKQERSYELDLIEAGIYCKEEINKNIVSRMMFDVMLGRRAITSSVVNKIFKKTRLAQVVEHLDEKISYGEDAAITYPYIAQCSKVRIINQAWYHYFVRDDSMVRTYDNDSFHKIAVFYKYMQKVFSELGVLNLLQPQLENYVVTFLDFEEAKYFGIKRDNTRYIFPFECIPLNSNIVLYGAGMVGRSYYKTLKSGDYANIVCWIDKNADKRMAEGLPVSPVETLETLQFDYIVIAIDKAETADSIRRDLIEKYYIPAYKIIWKQNKWT